MGKIKRAISIRQRWVGLDFRCPAPFVGEETISPLQGLADVAGLFLGRCPRLSCFAASRLSFFLEKMGGWLDRRGRRGYI